ncbi:MAG: hypothetical protein Q7T04_05450 [Dehalococcoidia bacterium]|nr:hypothetical protein [Dehalococcoidia bacterium]
MKRFSPMVATVALAALVFAAACSSAPAPTSTPGQTPAKTAIPTTSGPAATQRPTAPATQGLTLTIVQPQIEAVVTSSLLEVKGQTAPDAIVSVNGIIVKSVDASGNFTAVVTLEEGPNLVEIVASDYQNNQVSQTLAVIYTPLGQ